MFHDRLYVYSNHWCKEHNLISSIYKYCSRDCGNGSRRLLAVKKSTITSHELSERSKKQETRSEKQKARGKTPDSQLPTSSPLLRSFRFYIPVLLTALDKG